MGFRNVAVCLALGLSFAEGFAQPSAMGGRNAAGKAGSSSSCSKASAAGAGAPLKMSGGGNEGGLDKEAYYRRLKERQEEIKRGEGMQYAIPPLPSPHSFAGGESKQHTHVSVSHHSQNVYRGDRKHTETSPERSH
jgi:hypothetical protein